MVASLIQPCRVCEEGSGVVLSALQLAKKAAEAKISSVDKRFIITLLILKFPMHPIPAILQSMQPHRLPILLPSRSGRLWFEDQDFVLCRPATIR